MQNADLLIKSIKNGDYDSSFSKLYCTEDTKIINFQRERYISAINEFARLYGELRELRLYSAPGRTEIAGNHTDHNNGIVVAAAVNLDIIAVVSKSENNVVRVTSKGFDKEDIIKLNELTPQKREIGHSASLIRGVAADIVNRNGEVGGFDAYTTSDVLRGSGLSSSAAFEVIIGAIFNNEFNCNKFSAVEIAQISQFAENKFFNKPSGLMDQIACSVGSAIKIDFKTNGAPIVEKVEFDLARHGFALCITDTKGSHADLTDEYAAIRKEMESVAEFFGKNVLREISQEEFIANISKIRLKLGDRAILRAMHYFAECHRATEICSSIRGNNFNEFLKLINICGHSSFEYNQNVYSVRNVKAQGIALGIALSQRVLEQKGAWRLQGGGFAGTIQAFVPLSLLNIYCTTLENVFGENACHVLSVRNYGAICVNKSI